MKQISFVILVALALFLAPSHTFAATKTPITLATVIKKVTVAVKPKPIKPTLKIDVPYHHQEHALSCEAAGLRMLLLQKGTDEPENYIINKMSFGDMNSDPDQVFVGDINGRQMTTGYGIHPEGLLPIANTYFPAQTFYDADIHYLIDRLKEGKPSLVWIATGTPKSKTWTTPDGKEIHAYSGEHTVVVTGFAGDERFPTYIFVSDPINGEETLRTGDFIRMWSYFHDTGLFFQ